MMRLEKSSVFVLLTGDGIISPNEMQLLPAIFSLIAALSSPGGVLDSSLVDVMPEGNNIKQAGHDRACSPGR